MEFRRIKLVEPEGETIELDVWCERDSANVLLVARSPSFYGIWLDGDGDIYPFALRYDGILDYGVWSEDDSKGSRLALHGMTLEKYSKAPYQSKTYECDFELRSIFNGKHWESV